MQSLESRQQFWLIFSMTIGARVNDDATPEGALRRFVARDKMIAAHHQQRFVQGNLAVGRGFRVQFFFAAEQDDLG